MTSPRGQNPHTTVSSRTCLCGIIRGNTNRIDESNAVRGVFLRGTGNAKGINQKNVRKTDPWERDRLVDRNSWSQQMPEAIKKRRQETGEDFLTTKAWVDANATIKRVLRNSLTAFWDGQGNLEIIAWVSKGNDAPQIIANSPVRGSIQSLGLVSYDWLRSVPQVPIDLDTRLVNEEPLCSGLPEKLGFDYDDYRG